LVFAKCVIINAEDERLTTIEAPHDYNHAIWSYDFVGACFMYSRKAYETIGDYNPDLFLCEDYDYWLRIFNKYPVFYISEELYAYRRHDKALTTTHEKGQYEMLEKVLLKNFKDKESPVTLDKFYYYRGLHKSRSREESLIQKYKYFPILLCYKFWHKIIYRET
jgi:GT2 family glycosyltransferase